MWLTAAIYHSLCLSQTAGCWASLSARLPASVVWYASCSRRSMCGWSIWLAVAHRIFWQQQQQQLYVQPWRCSRSVNTDGHGPNPITCICTASDDRRQSPTSVTLCVTSNVQTSLQSVPHRHLQQIQQQQSIEINLFKQSIRVAASWLHKPSAKNSKPSANARPLDIRSQFLRFRWSFIHVKASDLSNTGHFVSGCFLTNWLTDWLIDWHAKMPDSSLHY